MARRKRTDSKPAPKPSTLTPHRDGWENTLTGLGQLGRDKTLGASFAPDLLSQEESEQLWRGDDIVARIVETVPNEMLREGFEVVINNEPEATEEVNEQVKEIRLPDALLTGLKYSRAYGGSGVLLGVNDGVDPLGKSTAAQQAYRARMAEPLDEDRLQSIEFLNVLTPRELAPFEYYSDPLLPNYGDVKTYRMMPIYAPPGAGGLGNSIIIHESRILRIPGEETTKRAMLTNVQPGWPDSILVRVMRVIANFQQAWQGVGILLQDFSFATLKIKGLAELLTMQGANADLTQRAAAMEGARGIARTTLIDAEEEYKRETTNVAGLSDLLERLAERLAAAAQMPVSLLFGQAPGGLNATGDADIRWFYDQVAAWQRRKLQHQIEYFARLLFLAKRTSPTGGKVPESFNVVFPPLWQPSPSDQASIRLAYAQADAVYITNGVLTPEEVAQSRFGGSEFGLEIALDEEARNEFGAVIDPETGEKPENPLEQAQVAALQAKANPAEKPTDAPPEEE